MSEQFEAAIERVKRDCALTASQMRCPHHFKGAKLEVERGSFDVVYIDVYACCGEFDATVRKALRKNLEATRSGLPYVFEGSEKDGRMSECTPLPEGRTDLTCPADGRAH